MENLEIIGNKSPFSAGGGGGATASVVYRFGPGNLYFPTVNPAPLETGVDAKRVKRFLMVDSTDYGLESQFLLPSTLNSGDVTFYISISSIGASSSNALGFRFSSSNIASGAAWGGAYDDVYECGPLAIADGAGEIHNLLTFTRSIADLGWLANGFVPFLFQRDTSVAGNLTGNAGLEWIVIVLP